MNRLKQTIQKTNKHRTKVSISNKLLTLQLNLDSQLLISLNYL